MIYTSSHSNFETDKYNTYAISGNRGKDADYKGKCYPLLAPKLSFWKVWHENIGVISKEENTKYYIQEYWNQVLSKLDPEQVYRELDNSVLLCYEPNTEFCHRHIVAAWFELLLDIEVPEIVINNKCIQITNRPTYIKEYLEEIIKNSIDMKDFNSLRARYLFEKSEKLNTEKFEEQTSKFYDGYKQEACFLRCDAYEIEAEYNNRQLKKIKD